MAEMRRFGLADLVLLVLVLAVAAGARAGYVWTAADGARTSGPLAVQDDPPNDEFNQIAGRLKESGLFMGQAPFAANVEQTAHIAPGYPYLLWAVGQVADGEQRDVLVRWVQVGLGALTAGFYFLFARRAFHSLLVGTLAGLFCAVHPFWVLDTPAINDGVLATFALALCLFLGSRAGETGGPFSSLLFGVSLAGLALVRAALLPFSFLAIGWFLLRTRTLPRGWLSALLAFLGFANGLAPWTIRNWQTYEEPVPVVDSAHYHLWVGNNPHATGGPVSEDALGDAPTEDLKKIIKQPDRYAKLGSLWWDEVQANPVETVRRRIWAGLDFVFGTHWFADRALATERPTDNQPMPDWLANSCVQVLQSTLLAMLLLAFLGWRWSYGWRRESMPAGLAMVWVPLPYLLSHAEALSGPRLPLDGLLLTYAAFTLACLIPGVGLRLLDRPRWEDRPEEYR